MTRRIRPPFRADHVGSLLRPAELAAARERFRNGEIDAQALRPVWEKHVREVAARQEAVGLEAVTDGEFTRDFWHFDFLCGFEGISLVPDPGIADFKGVKERPQILSVTGKVRRTKPVFVDYFKYLRSVTGKTPKLTIPSPAMLHIRGGRAGVDRAAYPDIEEMWEDVARAYREEIRDLAAAGCTYLQIDDTSHSLLCDPKFRAAVAARGDDADAMVSDYTRAINRALADRPAGMTVTMHTCRGNFQSSWVAEGGYEAVAESLFNGVDIDGFFLEYDSDRAGGFEPLRFMPRGKIVVLGLVTSKTPQLEDKDLLKRRIDEAAKYVPLEDLCLSPQCGFSSTHHGNKLTEDDQWRKLERVVEVARETWG